MLPIMIVVKPLNSKPVPINVVLYGVAFTWCSLYGALHSNETLKQCLIFLYFNTFIYIFIENAHMDGEGTTFKTQFSSTLLSAGK